MKREIIQAVQQARCREFSKDLQRGKAHPTIICEECQEAIARAVLAAAVDALPTRRPSVYANPAELLAALTGSTPPSGGTHPRRSER